MLDTLLFELPSQLWALIRNFDSSVNQVAFSTPIEK